MEEEPEKSDSVNICDETYLSNLLGDTEDTKGSQDESEKTNSEKDKDSTAEPPMPLVLEPDHPMMQRFQAALKTHLIKQIERLANENYELDNEVKKKEKEREKTGLELYTLQQEIYKQQKTLEDCDNVIENLMKERQIIDESLRCHKINWKEEVDRLNCAKKKESSMMAEFQRLSSVEKQMEKWEKEMESELTISQRISQKTLYDKNKLVEEKRKMDLYLLRLMTAVSNHESELKLLEGEINVKLEEKDMLNQTLADANADLQCLVAEQKRLLSSWNSVLNLVNHRNITYTSVSNELKKYQEAFGTLSTEIDSYKRSTVEEMKKNEKLAIWYGRIQTEAENNELILKNLTERKLILEEKIASIETMVERTEYEFQSVKEEINGYLNNINSNRNTIDKLLQDKRFYEDETMKLLQDQLTTDNSASYLNKMIKEKREQTRQQEFFMLEIENRISQKFFEIEELKETIARNNEIINETTAEVNEKEEELKKLNDEIARCQSAVFTKQGNLANLIRKIEKYTEKVGYLKTVLSPSQLRIIELEKANTDLQAKNDKLQSFWLLEQNNNLKLTRQRNEQLKDISLLRKQVLILEQKALKFDVEFEKERKIENNINRSILQLQHKLTVLNDILVQKKYYKENLGKENNFTQTQFIQNLKDAELEQLRLKAEIKELESSLEELAENMLSIQREMMAWDKKIQSAIETKNELQKERSTSGEVGQMKAEIHRMEIRFSQLKRVQDKLITDLELCVLRRDAILDGAGAAEKRQARGFNSRFMIQKKLENMKNSIRSLCNEQKRMEKEIEKTEERHKDLKNAILQKETVLLQMEETTKKTNQQLEDAKLQKFQNLEMLIRRQKKCKLYELVKSGKFRLLYKNEGVTEKELQKIRNANTDLLSVMETLLADFPAYHFELKKIYNSLQAQPS